MGSNFPGQSPLKCGHASQVASCGSHSAGMRTSARATVEVSLEVRCLLAVTISAYSAGFLCTLCGFRFCLRVLTGRRACISVDEPAGYGGVAINAPVAQKGPVAPNVFQLSQVDLGRKNLFLVVRSHCQHATEGIGGERP